MSRGVLVAIAVLVLGAGIALFVLLGGSKHADHGSATPGTQGPGTSATGQPGNRPTLPGEQGGASTQPGQAGGSATDGTAGTVSVTSRPRGDTMGAGDPTAAGGSGSTPGTSGNTSGNVSDYVVGDVHVRDHRGSNATTIDIPPQTHAPGGPRIQSTSTNLLGGKARTALYQCVKDTSRDGRGEHPRFEGQLVVDIKAEQATIVDMTLHVRDVPEAIATQVTQCMRPTLQGQSVTAPGEPDVTAYSINLGFAIP